ncbi:MAG: hypothetical protein EA390_09920 [Balneolaceae bacterium]|nr:MAG: hypothetical protein EA390_09920 [Balneolaceae bacterium]
MNNKIINITILVLIVLFVSFRVSTACSELNKTEQVRSSDPIENLPVAFSGFTPCADCPGIEYYLLIEEDGFKELKWYRDRSPEPIEQRGEWVLQGDTLTIYDEDNEPLNRFLYREDQLIMLSMQDEQITGELAEMHVIERSQEETSIRRHHEKLREEGVHFLASGNEPFWNIQINSDQEIRYRTPETEQFAPMPKKLTDTDRENFEFSAELESAILNVAVKKEYCRDTMSGFLFTHTVTVQLDGDREMRGCGRFLN